MLVQLKCKLIYEYIENIWNIEVTKEQVTAWFLLLCNIRLKSLSTCSLHIWRMGSCGDMNMYTRMNVSCRMYLVFFLNYKSWWCTFWNYFNFEIDNVWCVLSCTFYIYLNTFFNLHIKRKKSSESKFLNMKGYY